MDSRRILLLDEQAGSRHLVVLVLSRLGYRVEAVRTMGEVCGRLATSSYDLILLSATLGDVPGPDAVRQIRAHAARPVPVLVIGVGDGEVRTACLEAGAQGYLRRPIEIEALLRWMKATMAGKAVEPRAEQPDEPIVDLGHLCGFTDGDVQLERELAALYLSSADLYLARMDEALRTGDTWAASAHALKGASNNLGARRVAQLALDAERSPPSETQLASIRHAIEEVRRFFADRQG